MISAAENKNENFPLQDKKCLKRLGKTETDDRNINSMFLTIICWRN